MATTDCTQPNITAQRPKSGYGLLTAILDGIDAAPLLDRLSAYRHTGRQGYSVRAMWRAYLSKFVLKIRFNLELLERLRGSRRLREICGFHDAIPSESTFSRFTTRLADHQPLVEQCFRNVTEEVRDLLPKVQQPPGQQEQPVQPLGTVVAVDSTLFPSFSNANRPVVSDPDADWGLKNSAKAKDGNKEWMFGYKMHLIADAVHGLPLDFIITPANAADSPLLPTVLQKTLETYPWLRPKYLLGDKGYDALSNHEYLVGHGITPVLHLRKPQKGTLHDGIYTEDGSPTCMGQVAMEYMRTDPDTGHHLFKCPSEGCPLKTNGIKGMRYCDSEVWENPADNLRVIGVLHRASRKWKRLYKRRMSIERVFRSLKHSRALEGHMVRGMKKITLHATMSLLTYQATATARLKAGDYAGMRQMRVKVT